MNFATLPNGQPDGRLHNVSRDPTRATPARAAQTLQAALENWTALEPLLTAKYAALQQGCGEAFDPSTASRLCRAPGNGSTARRSIATAS